MKLALASDVHSEFGNQKPLVLEQEVDVLVLAGDIDSAKRSVAFAAQYVGMARDVVLIAGNHELYGMEFNKAYSTMHADAAEHPHVHFLERDTVELNGMFFHGTTAWTDFTYGPDNDGLHMLEAKASMNDYKKIKMHTGTIWRKLIPLDVVRENHKAKRFIFEEALPTYDRENSVVITHHAPCHLSIPEKYQGERLNHSYVNNWGDLAAYNGPKLWLHGHIHSPSDYMLGDTRVVANPIGYPDQMPDTGFIYLDI